MGYIFTHNSWTISFDEFSDFVQTKTSQYCNETILFPLLSSKVISSEKQYIQKIRDIQFERKIDEATDDYINAMSILTNDISKNSAIANYYNIYCDDIGESIANNYELECLDTSEETLIKDSKKFYLNSIKSIGEGKTFYKYNNIPDSFRRGVIHINMNDKDNLQWLLKENE